jgi:DNA-binding FadR family transcriptional regulator
VSIGWRTKIRCAGIFYQRIQCRRHFDYYLQVPFKQHDPLTIDTAHLLKETLLANLRSGRWRPGERLPAERQMVASYQVGRSTVRRVLTQMKEMGLITQTVGSGTYVAPAALEKLPPADSAATGISPAELMEARMVFEPALMDLVVCNANAADFAAMEECCRNAEAAETFEQFEYWDGALHKTLADATHNNFIIGVLNLINQVRERAEWGLLKKKSLTIERRHAYQREHRALVSALRDRDATAAKKAIVAHLIHVRQNLFNPQEK